MTGLHELEIIHDSVEIINDTWESMSIAAGLIPEQNNKMNNFKYCS